MIYLVATKLLLMDEQKKNGERGGVGDERDKKNCEREINI